MSGGFFRGTSADQDTRFSNKQAKLLKSQKFAPELENLVDMTKVKMDVMRPWIARRVTELIGFEDEVLINFIYGLLEGKQVNGKQVQISLTGFMERNTGKFMKELWVLLLSAQQNVSGVPQQFLDAKEEETKKKKAETDRIATEIQKKKEKEKQEAEQDKTKMDGDGAMSRERRANLELSVRRGSGRSSIQPAEDREQYKRNGLSRHSRGSLSPDSFHHSPSPSRWKRSISPMKSSQSRSQSNERQRSRSVQEAPPSRNRSISLERRCGPSPKQSLTPRRRNIIRGTPSPRRRTSYSRSRRRSPSPSRYRVRSPFHHRSRSPLRRRSRSPLRRRSRSPVWHRSRSPIRKSPVSYRSKTPLRGSSSSPLRHRTPSPMQGRRSPSLIRRRSPSPSRRRLPSPVRRCSRSPRHELPSPSRRRYRRSPSTPRQRSISPVRRRSAMHARKRSITPVHQRFSPRESSSASHIGRSSLSPIRRASPKGAKSIIQPPGERARRHEKYSPACRVSPNGRAELPSEERNTRFGESRPVDTLRSPQRDMLDRSNLLRKELATPSMRKYPFDSKGRSDIEEQRSTSPPASPYQRRENMTLPVSPNTARKAAGHKPRHDSSGTSADDDNKFSTRSSSKVSPTPVCRKDVHGSAEVHGLAHEKKSRNTQLQNSDGQPEMWDHDECGEKLPSTPKTSFLSLEGRKSYNAESTSVKDKKIARADDSKGGYRSPELGALPKSSMKSEQNDRNGSLNSPSKETYEHKVKSKEKMKHKLDRQEVESYDRSSYDSYEERKEAKRRRKEEKKLKREERRRRREERCRRKDGRHAEKLKFKSSDAGSSSSDLERVHSEIGIIQRRDLQASTTQGMDSDQKRLEKELREKALESLRAKKGFAN